MNTESGYKCVVRVIDDDNQELFTEQFGLLEIAISHVQPSAEQQSITKHITLTGTNGEIVKISSGGKE